MTETYQEEKNNLYQNYIIESNRDMKEKIKELEEKIKELEKEKDMLEEDNESMEKKLPYLRGIVINEHESSSKNYEIIKLMIEDRNKLVNDANWYILMKTIIFVIVLTSAPIAWSIYIFSNNNNIFSLYLTSISIITLFYFIFLPDFVFESNKRIELPKTVKDKLKIYKEHRKNNTYLEQLVNNC